MYHDIVFQAHPSAYLLVTCVLTKLYTCVCVCHCLQGWLCDVEDMMHATLKDTLRACRADLKKHLAKREKWVRDWPGQMLITSSQIQWTADCEKALDRGDKKGLKTLKKKQVS